MRNGSVCTPHGYFSWQPAEGLVRQVAAGTSKLVAADSWLVRRGRVRGLDLHYSRFASACADFGVGGAELRSFWAKVVASIPLAHQWFPRVELRVDRSWSLHFVLRPAPELATVATVWVPTGPDPRLFPHRKGPDLDRLGRLRAMATQAGAHDALLTTRSGLVLETAHAAVVWWEEDCLCLPSPTLATLPSVTAHLLVEAARRHAVPVRRPLRFLADLDQREVWLVNALHGIRRVERWVNAPVRLARCQDVDRWQLIMSQFERPLLGWGE